MPIALTCERLRSPEWLTPLGIQHNQELLETGTGVSWKEQLEVLCALDPAVSVLAPPARHELVAQDGEDPGPEVAPGTEPVVALERSQARRLDEIGRVARRGEGAREAPERSEVRTELGLELTSSPTPLSEQPPLPSSLETPERARLFPERGAAVRQAPGGQ